ncbi:mitogen-activated protein kinase kinase kinase 4-like [Ischnura elegans]|uniref:mitogen-activated protein kinase kinase kinase 4-like n=1 Tax=Ischnura elegans TaxID=197161 RepID=UPI001ED86DE8|nr:mitogen-activated protein kinase kinase kinase 4-like [Ischnura elegans]XP_046387838.1 mitogen-activated protein kinase kinase kinase 4-like [Ischnura elegans]
MASASRSQVKYVYDLPYVERKELCRILDCNDKWEELGGKYMNFDVMTIQYLRQCLNRGGKSPTDELLTMWGHQNHTVLELFVLLSKMQHYQSMLTLKPFVDPHYHRLIYEGEENLTRIFQNSPSAQFNPSHGCPSSPSKSNSMTANRNVCQPMAGPSTSAAPQTPIVHASTPSALAQNKSMEVGPHNLNIPDPPQVFVKAAVAEKPTHVVIQPEEKIRNTDRLQYDAQPPSNEENASVRTGLPQTQATGNRVPLEEKETNIPSPDTQKSTSRSRASDVAGASSVAESYGSIPHIAYKELLMATNGWDKSTVLGKGGFGTVFKGTWKNTLIAVKRIELRGGENATSHQAQMEQSLREMKFLNSYRHDNILPLYGYSLDGGEPCLLYQFMPSGSLEDRLLCRNGTPPLSWQQRHNIATGTARGLQFLHTIKEKPLIHGDIKSANILLDQNFEARIGDFGLAREGPNNQYTHIKVSRVHGTRPYLPDEFLRSKKISSKVDTYSFGIVLFELATGLRAYDEGRAKKFLKDHVEWSEQEGTELSLIDRKGGLEGPGMTEWAGNEGGVAACPNPEHNIRSSIFMDLLRLGKLCVKKRAGERPEMVLVLQELDAMAARREIACRALKLARINSLTPSNPYERQLIHDQRRMSPQPMSQPRASSPSGMASPYPGIAVVQPFSNPGSATSTASTAPSPHMFLPSNLPHFSNNPQVQYRQWQNPNNNHNVSPNIQLPSRVPSVHVHPPSPVPLEDKFQAHYGANNGYDGSRGSQVSQGIPSSMTVPYSEEFLPATIPGQGSDSITEASRHQVDLENSHCDPGNCDDATVLASQLLPRLSMLGIGEGVNQSCELAGTEVGAAGGPLPSQVSSSHPSTERSGPTALLVSGRDKVSTIFNDD